MDATSKFWYLEKFDLIQKMKKDEMMAMDKMMKMRKVDKDTYLHFPESKEGFVYFLKEGLVKMVHINEEGNEIIKYILSPGNIFGELSLLNEKEDAGDFAVAMDECVVCLMRVEDLKMLMHENENLSNRINKLIGFRIKRIERKLESLLFKNAKTRIIEFLMELAKDFGKQEGGKVYVKNFLSHEEMSRITSTSRQTVTTVLNELKQKGLIDYSSKKIELKTTRLLG